jgi:1-aminocyclopropane-1-carboxylate deaminase/D-cysteine desulfhydrase-like pyridoxal-dependent ACC family enzyme
MLQSIPIINQPLDHPLLDEKGIELAIKRLDLVHPDLSGNKFFKLKYNLEKAVSDRFEKILTFGGAFSNHIYASAAGAKVLNLSAIGIIRGERIDPLNPTLSHAESLGMDLHFVDRATYRLKKEPSFIKSLSEKFGAFYLIPEGGTNELAIKGTAEILQSNDKKYSHIATSIGTGGTFAGIYTSLVSSQKLLGFSALKGDFIRKEIDDLLKGFDLSGSGSFEIFSQFHFGGYAKYDQQLIEFIWWFYESFGIILDPIYTGKMLSGIWHLIGQGYFPKGSKILVIHSGGLQGNSGFTERTGIKLPSLLM